MDKDKELERLRHSFSHVMAAAIKQLYPDAKMAIGPAVANGFYYDFDFEGTELKEENLKEIEKKMKHIIKQNHRFKKREVNITDAITIVKKEEQPYKEELIKDLQAAGNESVSFYTISDFEDLCAGPHVESTNKLKADAFKLDTIAGAYWRGDEKNKMLTRIYGLAFKTKSDLEDYIKLRKEALERDHKKLGKELDLFCFSDLVGAGLPLYTPKGTMLKELLQQKVEKICRSYGFEKVSAPSLGRPKLFETSGHAKKFADELFHVSSAKGHDFVLKPVQCPHHTQIYASKTRSYRDLPIRYMESDKQYRAEKTGEVGGLSRVYAITIEDGHSFCEVEQVKEEVKNMVKIIRDFYTALGLWDSLWVSLSVRDYEHPEKYIGDEKDWDKCESMLAEVAKEMKLNAKRCEGEAALYGPKLDFMFKDALGKEIQIPTVQLDFATPKRFGLKYVNKKGEEESPVMVHRAILGSYERFMVILIEHFAGAFPVWLSPIQVKLISVGEDHIKYVRKLAQKFREKDVRVEIDINNETVGNKIRKATQEKVPYALVIGDEEVKSNKLSVRDRGSRDTRQTTIEELIKEIKSNG